MYEHEKTVHTASSDDCNALGLVMLMGAYYRHTVCKYICMEDN